MMNLYLLALAVFLLIIVAYFLGSKQSKQAFQFLTEDNGNFSITRLIVLLSNGAFLFVFIYMAIVHAKLIAPSWPLVVYLVFVNLLKVLQKHLESNPEMINSIIQAIRKK